MNRPGVVAAAAVVAIGIGTMFAASSAQAAERFAVVIGNNIGTPAEAHLHYAEDDARKVADALRTVGEFQPENIVVLTGAPGSEVLRVLLSVNDRLRDKPDAVLVVYYSGHADNDAIHTGKDTIAFAQLEQAVRGSSSKFRVLIVDACRSGELTQVKGAAIVPAFSLSSSPPSEGYVVLTAASANEDAQESAPLAGSFFTHHLVSGLLGAADADHDGNVTLDEAYRYAYDATVLSSSKTAAGTQHPTYRYDLRGKGELVLAALGRPQISMAVFEEPLDFLVFGPNGNLIAEVAAGAPNRAIAVPPGTLLVRARAPDGIYEGNIDVAPEQIRVVRTADLDRVPYARIVRKGAVDAQQASERSVAFAPALSLGFTYFDAGAATLAALRLPLSFSSITIGADLRYAKDTQLAQFMHASLFLENNVDFGFVVVGAYSFLGIASLIETFDAADVAPDVRPGAHPYLGPTAGLGIAGDVPIKGGVFARAACEGFVGFMLPFIAGDGNPVLLSPTCMIGVGYDL